MEAMRVSSLARSMGGARDGSSPENVIQLDGSFQRGHRAPVAQLD
jgi:hypothetical protein